jgi:hypothetical protein
MAPIPYVKTKLFPMPFVNSEGFRVGNYTVVVNKDILPFSSSDQVDHFLYNFFNYLKNEGIPKSDAKHKPIEAFFVNKTDNIYNFKNVKYVDKEKKLRLDEMNAEEIAELQKRIERIKGREIEITDKKTGGTKHKRSSVKNKTIRYRKK